MSCMQAGSCCPIFSSRPCDRTLVARYAPGKGKDSSNLLHAICGCCCRTIAQASIATPKEFIQYVDGAIFIPRKYGSGAKFDCRVFWGNGGVGGGEGGES